MEFEKNRLAYLRRYLELGPALAEEAQEEESLDQKFARLCSQSETYSEGFAAGRLAALVDMAQAQGYEVAQRGPDGRRHRAGSAPQAWPPALDYEGPHQPLAPCCCAGFCTCDFDTISE